MRSLTKRMENTCAVTPFSLMLPTHQLPAHTMKCVCVRACIYIYIYICLSVNWLICLNICVYVNVREGENVYIYIYACAWLDTFFYILVVTSPSPFPNHPYPPQQWVRHRRCIYHLMIVSNISRAHSITLFSHLADELFTLPSGRTFVKSLGTHVCRVN